MLHYNGSPVMDRQPVVNRTVATAFQNASTQAAGPALPRARFSGAATFPPRQRRKNAGRDTGCIAPRTFFPSCSALAAVLAQAMDFQRLRLWPEAEGAGLRLDQFGDARIADFLGAGAVVADQERYLVRLCRMVAGNIGVDGFELVDEALLEQEIERAIDGRRRCVAVALAQVIEQVIRLDRLARRGDQFQHFLAQRSQSQAALLAGLLDRGDETLGVFDVM